MSNRIVLASAGVGLSLVLIGVSFLQGGSYSARRPVRGSTAHHQAAAPAQGESYVYDMGTDERAREATSTTVAVATIESEQARGSGLEGVPAPVAEVAAEPSENTTGESPKEAADAAVAVVADQKAREAVETLTTQESPVAQTETSDDRPAIVPTAALEEIAARVDETPGGVEEAASAAEPVPAEAIVWSAPEREDAVVKAEADDEVPSEVVEELALLEEMMFALEDESGPSQVSGTKEAAVEPIAAKPEASTITSAAETPAGHETVTVGSNEDDVAFGAVVEEMADAFSRDLEALQARPTETRIAAALEVDEVVPPAEPAATAEPTVTAETAATAEPTATADAELDAELYSGLAFLLNHDAEELGEISPGPVSERDVASEPSAAEPVAPASGGRLANAVRLTRDAVVAWVSLLNGPAVVTISH